MCCIFLLWMEMKILSASQFTVISLELWRFLNYITYLLTQKKSLPSVSILFSDDCLENGREDYQNSPIILCCSVYNCELCHSCA